mgnify:CR=1 FL=1
MEEKGIRVCQMLEEMLENQEISQEEEGKIRKLFEEREDRRAEVRIAYDLLNLLQKEVRNEAAPVRMPGNQYGADLCNGFGTSLYQARLQARITQQPLPYFNFYYKYGILHCWKEMGEHQHYVPASQKCHAPLESSPFFSRHLPP